MHIIIKKIQSFKSTTPRVLALGTTLLTTVFIALFTGLLTTCEDSTSKTEEAPDVTNPTLSLERISQGDTTLSIKANEPVTLAVADDTALLAGIQVYHTPFEGERGEDNIATAATFSDNKITVTINTTAGEGDEFFVQVTIGMLEDTAGNKSYGVIDSNELSFKIPVVSPFIIADLPRDTTASDNYLTRYVTFSIRTGTATAGEYRIGAKVAAAPAPTATELIDATAAITRTLGTDLLYIYLPQHIDGTYFNADATKDYATLNSTQLSPGTEYKIYITDASGTSEVHEVRALTTDNILSTAPDGYGIPSPSYTYTIRDNEAVVLRLILKRNLGSGIQWFKDGTYITDCYAVTKNCLSSPSGYRFYVEITDTDQTYVMEIIEKAATNYSARHLVNTSITRSTNFTTQPTP